MSAHLILHSGGRLVTREEVLAVPVPEATATWFPVAHGEVLQTIERLLDVAGFKVARSQYALARNDHRFFAAIDLDLPVANGVGLSFGLRNSSDKSFPIGAAAGLRVVVCDNLSLCGDWADLNVARKHSRFGHDRFEEGLALGIAHLDDYHRAETQRVEQMQNSDCSDDKALALFAEAFERRIISHTNLRESISQWREPSHDWGDKTLWRAYNALTTPVQGRFRTNAGAFARQTMLLTALVAPLRGEQAPQGGADLSD